MASKKREREDSEITKKPKKIKFDNGESVKAVTSNLIAKEIDFPRGGGTILTPLEYKSVHNEATKEADMEMVFENSEGVKKKKQKAKILRTKASRKKSTGDEKHKRGSEHTRIEHLNYKRVIEGMKILCQIICIQPLSLIVSLPSQLFGHIPITHISTQLTRRLEFMEEEEANEDTMNGDDEERGLSRTPELFEIFQIGQYVRAVVTAVRPAGVTTGNIIGLRHKLDEVERACQRIELSLTPEKVNVGVSRGDFAPGFILPGAIQSVEDHGYILDFGVEGITGFLSFDDAGKGPYSHRLPVGHNFDVYVSEVGENRRTCQVLIDPKIVASSSLNEIASVTILPGILVQCMITAISTEGLNVQVLGYLEGTIDSFHIPPGDLTTRYKLGQKIKARVLWDIVTSEPRKFVLSLLPHVLDLNSTGLKEGRLIQDSFPIGTIFETVEVVKVDPEHGLIVQVQDGIRGYIHIRHVSDDHVPSLSPSSGHWKVGSLHRARVIGSYALDNILQISLQQSVLDQRFFQVQDVEVGEVFKATVKKLTSTALFVTLSGNFDGVIWPNHWADITLKRPQQRFKEGSTIKCKVLVVDADRKRIALTAKRTLVESDLPILSRLEDAQVGMITHAVVYKVLDKALLVEFYNNLKAQVPLKEASEVPLVNLEEAFPIGKPVKVRLTGVDHDTGRIFASIRQGNLKPAETPDVQAVQVGETVKGSIKEIHKDQAVLTLEPSGVIALVSLKNIANSRNITAAQLRTRLTSGEHLDDLIVLSQNAERGIVIVSTRPKAKTKSEVLPGNEDITTKSVQLGQIVSARVNGYGRGGSALFITPGLRGFLHPTDTCDDYDTGIPFPSQDTIIKGVIISIDKSRRHVVLSTRQSRLQASGVKVDDPEITSVSVLSVGQTVRGFIKSITEHGLFVMLGRTVDARVQIKELFDEYVKDWKPRFEVHQLVKGKIAKIIPESNHVEMTFRVASIELTLRDFNGGQYVDGVVRKKEPYGIFVQIKGTNVSGLCHKTEITDNEKADIAQVLSSFKEGDYVRAKILKVDLEKKRIAFGLKPSYFVDDDAVIGPQSELGDSEAEVSQHNKYLDQENAENDDDSTNSEERDNVDISESPLGDLGSSADKEPSDDAAPVIKVQGGFKWPGMTTKKVDADASSSDSTDDDGEPASKKPLKKKSRIQYDLTTDMHARQPESIADFERLLLGSPNSSYLWIQYMSFQLQLSEIEKAKEIGKRGLRTINFREEDEKLNVWIALLNLENSYGTDESLEAVFKDAARHNDAKTIYLRLAAIFDETDRHDRAVEQYQRTCKKFGKSSKVWVLFGECYFKHGDVEAARQLLPRSLLSLEKRKHLKTITKFASLEYRLGDSERGRTIFEGIVDSHSKRWDLWSIYIDMESTQKNIQAIRNILERVLALKMTSHKAKAFFKKWLELEKRMGDVAGQEAVKAKAIEWTKRAAGAA